MSERDYEAMVSVFWFAITITSPLLFLAIVFYVLAARRRARRDATQRYASGSTSALPAALPRLLASPRRHCESGSE